MSSPCLYSTKSLNPLHSVWCRMPQKRSAGWNRIYCFKVFSRTEGTHMPGDSFGDSLKARRRLVQEAGRYVGDHVHIHQTAVLSKLSKIFQLLLPTSPPHEMKRMQTIFTKAVSLKMDMAEENVMYHCYWAGRGQKFDSESMQTRLEESGPVSVCMFPGLAKSVERDGQRCVIHATKALVILQGQPI